jgi:hypothetical protein
MESGSLLMRRHDGHIVGVLATIEDVPGRVLLTEDGFGSRLVDIIVEVLQSDDVSNPTNLRGSGYVGRVDEHVHVRFDFMGQGTMGGVERVVDDAESSDVVDAVVSLVMSRGVEDDPEDYGPFFGESDGVHQCLQVVLSGSSGTLHGWFVD